MATHLRAHYIVVTLDFLVLFDYPPFVAAVCEFPLPNHFYPIVKNSTVSTILRICHLVFVTAR